jgi:hypothetical protein
VVGTASNRVIAESTEPTTSIGTSSSKRCIGSQTTVPALARASITTSGVRARKSAPVLDIAFEKRWCAWLCRGEYPECVIVTMQSGTSQP